MLCINWYQRGCHYFFPSHCRYFNLLVGYLRIETTSGRSNLIKLCASDIPWRCWHCIPYKLSFPQSFRFNFLKEWGQTKNDPSRNQIHDPRATRIRGLSLFKKSGGIRSLFPISGSALPSSNFENAFRTIQPVNLKIRELKKVVKNKICQVDWVSLRELILKFSVLNNRSWNT